MAVMETIRAWVKMSQLTILCRWMKKVARACVFHLWYPRSLICHCPPRTVMKPIYRHRPGLDLVEDNKRTYPFDVCLRVDEVIDISCPQTGLPPPMIPFKPISESKWWILVNTQLVVDQTLGMKLCTVTWNLIISGNGQRREFCQTRWKISHNTGLD